MPLVCKLNVSSITMRHALVVSTPIGGTILSDQIYISCSDSIEGHEKLWTLLF